MRNEYEVIKVADYWRVRRNRYLISTHRLKSEATKAMRALIRADSQSDATLTP